MLVTSFSSRRKFAKKTFPPFYFCVDLHIHIFSLNHSISFDTWEGVLVWLLFRYKLSTWKLFGTNSNNTVSRMSLYWISLQQCNHSRKRNKCSSFVVLWYRKYMNRTFLFNSPPDCMEHNKKYTAIIKFFLWITTI